MLQDKINLLTELFTLILESPEKIETSNYESVLKELCDGLNLNSLSLEDQKYLIHLLRNYPNNKLINEDTNKQAKVIANNIIAENKISDIARAKIENLIKEDLKEIKLNIQSRNNESNANQIVKTSIESNEKGKVVREKILKIIEEDLKENGDKL